MRGEAKKAGEELGVGGKAVKAEPPRAARQLRLGPRGALSV